MAIKKSILPEANETQLPKTYIIESPNKNYCGEGAGGVHFAYGKAEICDGWVLQWYREKGYKVIEK